MTPFVVFTLIALGSTSLAGAVGNVKRDYVYPSEVLTTATLTSETTEFTTVTSTLSARTCSLLRVTTPLSKQVCGAHGTIRSPVTVQPAFTVATPNPEISCASSCRAIPKSRCKAFQVENKDSIPTCTLLGKHISAQDFKRKPVYPATTQFALSCFTQSCTQTPVLTETTTSAYSTVTVTTTVTSTVSSITISIPLNSPTSVAGASDPDSPSPISADDEDYPVQLPFPITILSGSSNQLYMNINGVLRIRRSIGNVLCQPFSSDLYIYQNSTMGLFYQIDGAAPHRRAIFEWEVGFVRSDPGAQNTTFFLVFYEDNPGAWKYLYYRGTGNLATGSSAYVGYNDVSTGKSKAFSYGQSAIYPGLVVSYDPISDQFTTDQFTP